MQNVVKMLHKNNDKGLKSSKQNKLWKEQIPQKGTLSRYYGKPEQSNGATARTTDVAAHKEFQDFLHIPVARVQQCLSPFDHPAMIHYRFVSLGLVFRLY